MFSAEGEGNSWCILFALDGFFPLFAENNNKEQTK